MSANVIPLGAATAAAPSLYETIFARLASKPDKVSDLQEAADLLSLRAARTDSLQPEDFKRFGAEWDIRPAAIHALADAESSGRGILADGRMLILPEPHVFSKLTNHVWDKARPDVSYPKWTPYRKGQPPPPGFIKHPYLFNQEERYELLADMLVLDIEAGVGSLSAGRFQQLVGSRNGNEGWRMLGFESGVQLFRYLATGEPAHLDVLQRYLSACGLMQAFRDLDWRRIARAYNGPGQVDLYAGKMAAAYEARRRLY